MSTETFQINAIGHLLQFLLPTSRVFVLYLLTSLILAMVVFWQVEAAHRREHPEDAVKGGPGIFRRIFDPRVWLHPSSRQDYLFFVVNAFVYYGLISQFLLTTHGLTDMFHAALVNTFGERTEPLISSLPALALYTIAGALCFDFGIFITHTAMHKVPILWHFHKVHHSAEALNPMTLFRMHPVDLFITALGTSLITGPIIGGLFFLTGQPPEALTVFGLNVILFLFYLLGYNLRHMEVWIAYPAWLSNILISPAQHQIHHSADRKHWDKNMGLVFAFWDRMFKTLYVPRGREELSYGISHAEPNPFHSVRDLYVKPFVWAAQTFHETVAGSGRRAVAYSAAIAGLALYANILTGMHDGKTPGPGPYLPDMSWTDVQAAIVAGYDTVIIPTGGVEQGGPYVALGKHNFIVRETSTRIARQVGRTLVAPVMAYVPEGEINPPSKHMPWPGTISLPEPVFEQVIEAAARSMKQHGFRNIFVLGDSGDSQAAQKRAVERLAAEWAGTDTRIAQMDDYYFRNGQTEALLAKGYSREQIGWHAGMRDMSELMYVAPEMVRTVKNPDLGGKTSGYNGDIAKASAKIGEEMIALKVRTGVAEMRGHLKDWGRPVPSTDDMARAPSLIDRMKTAATE